MKHSDKKHDHVFDQDRKRPGESRTLAVVGVTAAMMVVEVGYGVFTGSMALLADGLHMASHAAALGINVFAYFYARRHAHNDRFSFGTGKVNALGGYSGAVLLGVFAGIMAWESLLRFFQPVNIQYSQAIAVAVIGLIVNGVSVLILQGGESHHEHKHEHAHESSGSHTHDDHEHDHEHEHGHSHDHNLKSAYLHVLADALTSILAIIALVAAMRLGWVWMDPLMGIIGAALVLRWSWGLLRATSAVLLDHQGPESIREKIRRTVESMGDARVTDLHLWSIAPKHYAAIVSIVSKEPRTIRDYQAAIQEKSNVSHITIEVHREE